MVAPSRPSGYRVFFPLPPGANLLLSIFQDAAQCAQRLIHRAHNEPPWKPRRGTHVRRQQDVKGDDRAPAGGIRRMPLATSGGLACVSSRQVRTDAWSCDERQTRGRQAWERVGERGNPPHHRVSQSGAGPFSEGFHERPVSIYN